MKEEKKLGAFAGLFYALYCITTLGGAWLVKVIIQKAIIDAQNGEEVKK